jgi:hypothetical protein
VPHGQITRVEVSTVERAGGLFGVLEVTLHDDVSAHDNLAERFTVTRDICEFVAGRFGGIDDAEWGRGGVGVALPRIKFGPFGRGERRPGRLWVVEGEGAVSLPMFHGIRFEWKEKRERETNIDVRQAISVYKLETSGFQLNEQVRGGRSPCDCRLDWVRKLPCAWMVRDSDLCHCWSDIS